MAVAYSWKNGFRKNSLDAQVVGERLEQLYKVSGLLTAKMVVDDARSQNSPLHPAFEWDDAIAAEEHRLEQARNLIRHVTVKYQDTQPQAIRAYAVVQDENERTGYATMLKIMSDKDMRRQVLRNALRDFESFERKYNHLQELAELFETFRNVKDAVESLGASA